MAAASEARAGLGERPLRAGLLIANHMLSRDEPDHRRLRKLVDRSFQRRDIGHMRGRIEAIADRLLDQMGDRGEIDLVSTYARRLPMAVICDLLGLAEADQESFGIWTRKMVDIKGPLDVFGFIGGLDALIGYLQAQIEDCRRKPRAGLIADLVREEQDGDRLSESELLSMILLLLVAGFETTSHLISGAVLALEAHPEQKAWLLAEPQARIERAVEELARFVTPVETTKPRYVAQDVTFFGQEMSRGDVVLPSLAAANHDPAVFGHPDRLDLDRFPNPHLVFSSGIHFCLGMQLARVEAQSALLRLYARRPNLQVIAPDRLPWIEQLGIRGMRSLPVRFG